MKRRIVAGWALLALILGPAIIGVAAQENGRERQVLDRVAKLGGIVFKVPGGRGVDFTFKFVSDAELEGINELADLKKLVLFYTLVGSDGLKHFRDHENLTELDLRGTAIDREGLSHLSTLESLTIVNLARTKIEGRDIKFLRKLGITSLDLSGTTTRNLQYVAQLTKLKELDLGGSHVEDFGLKQLVDKAKGPSTLTKLSLRGTRVTDDGMKYVAAHPNLTQLDLGGLDITNAGLKHLAALTKLEKLDLTDNDFTDGGLQSLEGMTKLKILYLGRTSITDNGIAQLGKMNLPIALIDVTGTAVTESAIRDHLPNADSYGAIPD